MGAPRISLDTLTVARAGRVLLRDVTLDVGAGDSVALVGPSGSGKSSLLRCLVRLDEPAGGAVRLDGRDIRELDPCELRRRVGLVTQAPVMLPGSVRDNLAYGLDDPPPAALGAALERAGLSPDFTERAARELSGGESARVAVARALVREPAALLLDEPTAALDREAAGDIEELIRQLAAGGLAIVMVTHDEPLAARVAERAVRLGAGSVQAAGRAAEVLRP
ncbi:MAG: UDP-glucose/iron transport system ATP-binding protein [Thermoleophilaceae bacterium]|jgi:ABC-type multidrug transport system fused ATPase/permease subunit|nr:UDP-glucose/iron transport system ATP-binding protein [Thermoleophilaceae bacterium]